MDKTSIAKIPFYGWECLSLQLKNRGDVYFLIQNEKTMADFLKLLIFELKSLDGNAGSALKKRKAILKQELKSIKVKQGGRAASREQQVKLKA